jgi:hypothetical protein
MLNKFELVVYVPFENEFSRDPYLFMFTCLSCSAGLELPEKGQIYYIGISYAIISYDLCFDVHFYCCDDHDTIHLREARKRNIYFIL